MNLTNIVHFSFLRNPNLPLSPPSKRTDAAPLDLQSISLTLNRPRTVPMGEFSITDKSAEALPHRDIIVDVLDVYHNLEY